MRQLTRLLRYVAPVLVAVAVVVCCCWPPSACLDAFRVLLIGPIFDRVLNPGRPARQNIQLFRLPGTGQPIYLQQFVPSHFQNPWTVVAFALVACDHPEGNL